MVTFTLKLRNTFATLPTNHPSIDLYLPLIFIPSSLLLNLKVSNLLYLILSERVMDNYRKVLVALLQRLMYFEISTVSCPVNDAD